MKSLLKTLTLLGALGAGAFHSQPLSAQSKDAEPATRAANEAFVKSLPFSDRADFDDAKRGFIATLPDGVVAGVGNRPAWDTKPYAFLQKDAVPSTVNPSLWRQAQLNAVNGLFMVTERVYQVRGLDLANLTIIEGVLRWPDDLGLTKGHIGADHSAVQRAIHEVVDSVDDCDGRAGVAGDVSGGSADLSQYRIVCLAPGIGSA